MRRRLPRRRTAHRLLLLADRLAPPRLPHRRPAPAAQPARRRRAQPAAATCAVTPNTCTARCANCSPASAAIDIIWFDFSYPDFTYRGLPGKGRNDWQSEKLIRPGARTPARHPRQQPAEPAAGQCRLQHPRTVPAARVGARGRQAGALGSLPDLQRLLGLLPRRGYLEEPRAADADADRHRRLRRQPAHERRARPAAARSTAAPPTRWTCTREWMRAHGRSIYGCTQSEFAPPQDCRFTQNGEPAVPAPVQLAVQVGVPGRPGRQDRVRAARARRQRSAGKVGTARLRLRGRRPAYPARHRRAGIAGQKTRRYLCPW